MIKLRSYAKINLTLEILRKRADGYHDIDSIMQSVSLHDVITIEKTAKPGIEIVCSNSNVPAGKDNIAYKAAEAFLKCGMRRACRQAGSAECGIKIQIEKNIPVAAGLAGGSSNAAAVLYGLNRMEEENERLTLPELIRIGEKIGSDVPFCLVGGMCEVTGRGELLEQIEANEMMDEWYVLVVPDIQVPTKWAYEEFDRHPRQRKPSHELKWQDMSQADKREQAMNDLEPIVTKKYPEVLQVKEELNMLGCPQSQMSGSGPSVFAIVSSQKEAENISRKMKQKYLRSFAVEKKDRGVEII